MSQSNTVSYKLIGNGKEKVVLLHGWWSDSSCYDNMLNFVNKRNFTYCLIDYRGYGGSKDISGNHTIKEIADDVFNVANQLAWSKFHVIGHSMGGMVAQYISAAYHESIKSVIATTPVAANGSPLDEDGKDLFYNAALKDDNRIAILKYLTSDKYSEGFYDFILKNSRETTSQEAFHNYMLAWTGTDFSSMVKGIDIPCLTIVGSYDQAITANLMKDTLLKWYPVGHLEIIENSGHFPMHETPAQLVKLSERFMKKYS